MLSGHISSFVASDFAEKKALAKMEVLTKDGSWGLFSRRRPVLRSFSEGGHGDIICNTQYAHVIPSAVEESIKNCHSEAKPKNLN